MFIYISMSLTCINYFQFRFNRILSDTKYNVDVKIKKNKIFSRFFRKLWTLGVSDWNSGQGVENQRKRCRGEFD